MPSIQKQKRLGALAAAAIAAGIWANVYLAPMAGDRKVWAWGLTVATMLVLCTCIGGAIANRWDGVLVDARNRISLSRLQMLAWTVLVISALVTAASSNLALDGNASALNIAIPGELLAAMGIAATSLAAAPALLSLKDNAANAGARPATNGEPQQAGWLEIFKGDQVNDEQLPDLSKIQQFLITLALVGVYGVAIVNMLLAPWPPALPLPTPPDPAPVAGSFWALPPLDQNFIWLLGISHAGYLTYKATSTPGGTASRTNPNAQPAPDPGPAPS